MSTGSETSVNKELTKVQVVPPDGSPNAPEKAINPRQTKILSPRVPEIETPQLAQNKKSDPIADDAGGVLEEGVLSAEIPRPRGRAPKNNKWNFLSGEWEETNEESPDFYEIMSTETDLPTQEHVRKRFLDNEMANDEESPKKVSRGSLCDMNPDTEVELHEPPKISIGDDVYVTDWGPKFVYEVESEPNYTNPSATVLLKSKTHGESDAQAVLNLLALVK
jgi:hypothetical protein